jgi:hypothetical protein
MPRIRRIRIDLQRKFETAVAGGIKQLLMIVRAVVCLSMARGGAPGPSCGRSETRLSRSRSTSWARSWRQRAYGCILALSFSILATSRMPLPVLAAIKGSRPSRPVPANGWANRGSRSEPGGSCWDDVPDRAAKLRLTVSSGFQLLGHLGFMRALL